MKKVAVISVILTAVLLTSCGRYHERTVESETDAVAYSVIDVSGSAEKEKTETVSAVELAVQAADVARRKIFHGCTIGIMRGGQDDEYVRELTEELTQRVREIGYTINTDGKYSEETDVSLIYTAGNFEDAVALLTREDIVLIICCDMDSTERLLSSDNEYRCVGETIAAVGMNDEECKRIEHR